MKLKDTIILRLNHNTLFLLFIIAGAILFSGPLNALTAFAFRSDLYSHIPFIPFISLYLIYTKRLVIFSNTEYSFGVGIPILFLSLTLLVTARLGTKLLSANDYLCLASLSAVMFWAAGFITSYSVQSYRKALFPLLLLMFMIPFPETVQEMITAALQRGSLEASYWIFKIIGVDVSRDGFVLSLPGLNIRVAKECSGIRSAMVLFLTSILAGHLFLRTSANKTFLALASIPIAILKNGVRIVTLSLLAIHVDMRILSSDLHRHGGIPFFVLAMMLLAMALGLFLRTEKHSSKS